MEVSFTPRPLGPQEHSPQHPVCGGGLGSIVVLDSLDERKNLLPVVRIVDSSWNLMAHDDTREGNWRGNWRMEWVASTLHPTSEHGVSSIPTAHAHTSAASSRLNWRPRRFKWTRPFAERRNLVSARVSSHFRWAVPRFVGHLKGERPSTVKSGDGKFCAVTG